MQDISSKSKKRILKDRRELLKNPLHECGIYIEFDEDNMKYAHVLIIGPPDTRYEKGFYLFHIEYPNNYPFSPMKFTFLTSNGKTRMNPNLYVNGKVCISILGTWSGPGWTSCQTTTSVLLSLLSLFNMNPINNEPGYAEHAVTSEIAIKYNKIIDYQNINLAVYKMTKRKPHPCPALQLIMVNYVKDNYDWYISKIKENMVHNNELITLSVYNKLSEKLKYKELLTNFIKFYDYINIKPKSDNKEDTVSTTGTNLVTPINSVTPINLVTSVAATALSPSIIKKKSVRKAPTKSSGKFEIGYKMISENDPGCYYIVKQMNNGTRWIKCK